MMMYCHSKTSPTPHLTNHLPCMISLDFSFNVWIHINTEYAKEIYYKETITHCMLASCGNVCWLPVEITAPARGGQRCNLQQTVVITVIVYRTISLIDCY